MANNNLDKDDDIITRWKIFNRLLHRPEGVSYKEWNTELEAQGIICLGDKLRKDKEKIDKLLAEKGYPKIQVSGGRNKKMFITDQSIDICALKDDRRPSRYYRELLDMLAHTDGLLDEDWLQEMNVRFDEAEKDWSGQGAVISFEKNYNAGNDSYLANIFGAIRKRQVLDVEFCPYHLTPYHIIFHPEYLKQYRRLWYAYGLGKNQDSENNDNDDCYKLLRIPLDRIKNISVAKDQLYLPSGTDYEEYFDEIIGVDNMPGREVETIRIKVKSNIAERFENSSYIDGLKPDKDNSDEKYTGYKFKVKRNKELIRYICSFGSDMIVTAPKELVKDVKKELTKAINLYKE